MRLYKGLLVAFEGIDGAGKTTQANELRRRLEAAGLEVLLTKEPTQGPYGQAIRASARGTRLPLEEELRLFHLDRAEHVDDTIRPALEAGQVVIVDRYFYSTAAYQGARGADPEQILATNRALAPEPDLLVVLDVPAPAGLGRVRGRGDEPDAFERVDLLSASQAIFARVRPPGCLWLDGLREREDLSTVISDTVYHLLRDRMPETTWAMLPGLEAPLPPGLGAELTQITSADLGDTEKVRQILAAIQR